MNNELIDELRKYAAELEELVQVYDEKIKGYDKQRWNVSSVMHALNDFLAKHDNLNGEPEDDLEQHVFSVIELFPKGVTLNRVTEIIRQSAPEVRKIAVAEALRKMTNEKKIEQSRDGAVSYYKTLYSTQEEAE